MNEERSAKIWSEIQTVLQETSLKRMDGEKTTNELCEEWGIGRSRARSVIDRLVRANVLLRRGNRMIFLRPNPDIEDVEQAIRDALMV
jgi:DNA-binding GntR family transcriptional regulator